MDFTLPKYEELCDAILQSGYTATSVKDYLLTQPKDKIIILRYDVDKKPENALKMGEPKRSKLRRWVI